jgi:hypothetical protein
MEGKRQRGCVKSRYIGVLRGNILFGGDEEIWDSDHYIDPVLKNCSSIRIIRLKSYVYKINSSKDLKKQASPLQGKPLTTGNWRILAPVLKYCTWVRYPRTKAFLQQVSF